MNMNTRIEKYAYRVLWSEEDGEFVGQCAEFPSLSWLAESQEAALHGVGEVVRQVVEDMEAEGETVPEPLSLRRFSGHFTVRVPPHVHREIALRAAEEGVSLNRYVSARLSG